MQNKKCPIFNSCFFETQPTNTARKVKLIGQFVSFSSRHFCALSQVAFQAMEEAPVNVLQKCLIILIQTLCKYH